MMLSSLSLLPVHSVGVHNDIVHSVCVVLCWCCQCCPLSALTTSFVCVWHHPQSALLTFTSVCVLFGLLMKDILHCNLHTISTVLLRKDSLHCNLPIMLAPH